MRRTAYTFPLFMFMMYALLLADAPQVSQGEISFYLDRAIFVGHEDHRYIEFYLMLFADQFAPRENGKGRYTALKISSKIIDTNGVTVSNASWTTQATIAEGQPENLSTLAIYDQWSEQLKPGDYRLRVVVQDSSTQKSGEITTDLMVTDYGDQNISASDIEFVSRFQDNQPHGIFSKGNRAVIPNPSRRYGVLNPYLYFYYELDGLQMTNRVLQITYSLMNERGEVAKRYAAQEIQTKAEKSGILHGLNISSIPSGIYSLVIDVVDRDSGYEFKASRQFEVLQLDYFGLDWQMTAEEAERSRQLLQYIAAKEEVQLYETLDLAGKAQFLTHFWRQRDPSPETIANEYLSQIKQRFNYANSTFAWGEQEGWESERGRVLIQNGMPDNIGHHFSESGMLPYEIWYYQKDKANEFIFGDLYSNGNFILLHSTKEGEVRNQEWRQILSRY